MPRSNQRSGVLAQLWSSVRRKDRIVDPANRRSWPDTVACLFSRAQTRGDHSGCNVPLYLPPELRQTVKTLFTV
jgi:hypothetical protein